MQRFAALWQALAKHYAGTDPEMVFFEIMNEPEQDGRVSVARDRERGWRRRFARCAAAHDYRGGAQVLRRGRPAGAASRFVTTT